MENKSIKILYLVVSVIKFVHAPGKIHLKTFPTPYNELNKIPLDPKT